MRKLAAVTAVMAALLSWSPSSSAATQPTLSSETQPARLLQFRSSLLRTDAPGLAGVTFAVYRDQEGGAPLWTETQNVEVDARGEFSVVLGAIQRIPMEIFTSGDARWLGIQRIPESEQPRILLAAVPYALKAADADTLGGKPLSAFVLAEPATVDRDPLRNPTTRERSSVAREGALPPLAGSQAARALALRPVSNAIATTGFFLSSISGNTSIGFATTSGEWRVYLKSSSAPGFNDTDLRLTMNAFALSMMGTVHGETSTGRGIEGVGLGSGSTGVYGESGGSFEAKGVHGFAYGLSGFIYGGYFDGSNNAAINYGAYGTGGDVGIFGTATGTTLDDDTFGVWGSNPDTAATNTGVLAQGGDYGVRAWADGQSNETFGVFSEVQDSPFLNYGVFGRGQEYGVYGVNTSNDTAHAGVVGVNETGSAGTGVLGQGFFGVRGTSAGSLGAGVYGKNFAASGTSYGGYFDGGDSAATNHGVYGTSGEIGVSGVATGTSGTVFGGKFDGGNNAATNYGILSTGGDFGIVASGNGTTAGVATYGVYGQSQTTAAINYGVFADGADWGLYAWASTAAGTAIGGRNAFGGDLMRLFGVTNNDAKFRVATNGDVFSDGAYLSPAADLAERINVSGALEPGDVVEIDVDAEDGFRRSSSARSTLVVGVVSTVPGVLLNDRTTGEVADDHRPALALAGKVPVKVSAENGPIRAGDLLVASSTPGYAMRADDAPAPGTVVGKALQSFDAGLGTIRMLVVVR